MSKSDRILWGVIVGVIATVTLIATFAPNLTDVLSPPPKVEPRGAIVTTVEGGPQTTVNYQDGEWLFSNPDGSYTAILDSHCELSEDSCSVSYADGLWTLREDVP